MAARPKSRLDQRLTELGLAASRERARALILAGRVLVDGRAVTKAGTPIHAEAGVTVTEPDIPWVGRGGVKLAHALEAFAIDVTGREALDIGASTGGFTDVLLQRGARRVVALDVGHGQLDWRIREDPRVIVLEHRNAREMDPSWLPGRVGIVTIDVSFISLRLIFPVLPAVLAPGADIVALVKPQFEAGREEVGRGGLVKDPAVHEAVIARVTDSAGASGLVRRGLTPSPITGATGNQEYLMHLQHAATGPAAGSRA
jgi:23S rRNA (cytidine1920-2'-O)/16S rRNA (cytidine1409-2'-O)-methyltransferase